MDGASKVRYSLAFLGGGLFAARAYAADRIEVHAAATTAGSTPTT